jgi:hypothetical protein
MNTIFMHRWVMLSLSLFRRTAYAVDGVSPGSAESLPNNPRAGLVAYAVPSSSPYCWQNGSAFLNYAQWKHGATWAVADYYLGSCGADTRAKHLGWAVSVSLPPRAHEKA